MALTQLTTPQKELKAMLDRDDMKAAFKRVLGENAGAFMASIVTAVNMNDRLKLCAPDSVVNSAMLAASLNLPVEASLGQAWIIPYNSKEGPRAQFQIGYKGIIQLALRTGEYETIHAGEIHNGITVKINPITGKVDWSGEPLNDEVIGYIAYFKLRNGFERALYMSVKEITEHAKRYSKSFGKTDSPWNTHPHEMGKKTVLKRLLTKYGILSVQMRRAVVADETPLDNMEMGDIVPGKVVDATPKPRQSKEANLEQLTGLSQPRPWSPEYIREKVTGWTLDMTGNSEPSTTDNQRKVLAAVLDKVVVDKTKRYEICEYLTGKSSTQDMNIEVKALLHWLGVSRFEDVPTSEITKEIHAVHAAALKAKGQMEMAGVA